MTSMGSPTVLGRTFWSHAWHSLVAQRTWLPFRGWVKSCSLISMDNHTDMIYVYKIVFVHVLSCICVCMYIYIYTRYVVWYYESQPWHTITWVGGPHMTFGCFFLKVCDIDTQRQEICLWNNEVTKSWVVSKHVPTKIAHVGTSPQAKAILALLPRNLLGIL